MNQKRHNSQERIIGGHISIASVGLGNAHKACTELGINGVQIHPSPPQRWNLTPYDKAKATELINGTSALRFLSFHGIYLINLATPDADKLAKAKLSLINDLTYARYIKEQSNLEVILVFHVGSLKDEPVEEVGLKRASEALIEILKSIEIPYNGVKLALEVSAGSGKVIGSNFKSLATIYGQLGKYQQEVGFALDTQHMFASGYDLINEQRSIIKELEQNFGIDNLLMIHLNDSKTKLGSHVDRHANLGILGDKNFDGNIGIEALVNFVTQPELENIPLILETPNMKGFDTAKECYALLKQNLVSLHMK